MLVFRLGQRIRVTEPTSLFVEWTGTVASLHLPDNSAYVDMDEQLPDAKRQFPARYDSRRNWLKLMPEDCEELTT